MLDPRTFVTASAPASVSAGALGGLLSRIDACAMLLGSVPSFTTTVMSRVSVSGAGLVLLNRTCSRAVS